RFSLPVKVGKNEMLRTVEDMTNYFLVWDEPFPGDGTVSNAHKRSRQNVGSYVVNGFTPGKIDFTASTPGLLTKIADNMKNNPSATCILEGFAGGTQSTAGDEKLAESRALLIRDLVIDAANNKNVVFRRRFSTKGTSNNSRDEVTVTIDQPK